MEHIRAARPKIPHARRGDRSVSRLHSVLAQVCQSPTLDVGIVRLPFGDGARKPNHPHAKRGGFMMLWVESEVVFRPKKSPRQAWGIP